MQKLSALTCFYWLMEASSTLLDQSTTDLLVLWLYTTVQVVIFLVEVATKLVRVMENGVDQLLFVKVQSALARKDEFEREWGSIKLHN